MSHSAVRFGFFVLIQGREGAAGEEEQEGNHPILERCSSRGVPQVMVREGGREGNEGAWGVEGGQD